MSDKTDIIIQDHRLYQFYFRAEKLSYFHILSHISLYSQTLLIFINCYYRSTRWLNNKRAQRKLDLN